MTPHAAASRPFLALSLALGLALAGGHAFAAKGHEDVAFSPTAFAEQREAIERDLAGDRYAEISRSDRAAVREALGRIGQALEGKDSLDLLAEEERVAVFNDQELVNTTLTRAADDSRLVCRREKKVGTHFKSNVCMTVAERRRAQESARERLLELERLEVRQGG